MALKLFRSTGHSTLLLPGETRIAWHPGALIAGVSLWLAVAANVGLWRIAAQAPGASWREALIAAGLVGGGAVAVLSLLGWRRTLKPAATLLLLLAALVACGLWTQALPIDALWTQRPRALLPPWASLLRWQVPALLAALALLPALGVWNMHMQRLSGPVQLRVSLLGMVLGAALFALTASLVVL